METSTSLQLTRIDELLRRRDYQGGLREIDAARGMANDMPETDRILLDLFAGECLAFSGNYEGAVQLCQKLAGRLRMGSQHLLYARCCFSLAVARYYMGNLDLASEHAQIALHSFKRADELEGVARCWNWLGNISFDRGDFTKAIEQYEECRAIAVESGLPRFAANARENIARACLMTGDLVHAAESFSGNADYYTSTGDQLNLLRHDLSCAFLSILQSDFDAARMTLDAVLNSEVLSACIRERAIYYEYSGELHLRMGRLDAAATDLLRAIHLGIDSHDESVIGQSRRLLAEVRLAEGDFDEALAEGKRALTSIRKVGERYEEGALNRVLGVVHGQRGLVAETRLAFDRSIELLRSAGARFEWAKSCLTAGSAEVYSRRERLASLVEADRLFTEIGVQYWIDETRSLLEATLQDRENDISVRLAGMPKDETCEFVTVDPATQKLLHLAKRFIDANLTLLITGETGSGKDQLAKHLHAISARRNKLFKSIDLNTISESLWQSELYGHRRGSFTGASGDGVGLLESANGGVVFLNEIGNLSLELQAKLLELLDSHQVRRVGDTKPITLDIQFIAATNVDLAEAVAQGRFRRDLYYRLAEAAIHLAPLRERRADIVPLMRRFMLERFVPAGDLPLLEMQVWVDRAHNGYWEGNARQLRGFVNSLIAIADRPSHPDFPTHAARLVEEFDIIREAPIGARVSRERLLATLERNDWNQRATARDLGMTEGGVRHYMRRFGIQRPEMA